MSQCCLKLRANGLLLVVLLFVVHQEYSIIVLCCAVQRFFSATLQNFATQSLLMAVGVGARKALAASAAINWMLKDGMNRLVRMGVATQFGDSFDSDLKVWWWTCLHSVLTALTWQDERK